MDEFKVSKNGLALVQNKIETLFLKSKIKEAAVDITSLNLIDAISAAVNISTKMYLKFPEKKILWNVKDDVTKKLIGTMKLNNMEIGIKEAKYMTNGVKTAV